MTPIQAQASRDAVDAKQGAQVWCPYCPVRQPEQYNAWTLSFNAAMVELEAA